MNCLSSGGYLAGNIRSITVSHSPHGSFLTSQDNLADKALKNMATFFYTEKHSGNNNEFSLLFCVFHLFFQAGKMKRRVPGVGRTETSKTFLIKKVC